MKFPLFYDNYFVPRGYAVLDVDMDGTTKSDGCPTSGGLSDVLGGKAVIDWLNGRATAYDAQGKKVKATWTNGRTGMIGKSYDGTLANGVAATGVEGLDTIVPISAISSWYDYSRMNGTLWWTGEEDGLADTVDTDPCGQVRRRQPGHGDRPGRRDRELQRVLELPRLPVRARAGREPGARERVRRPRHERPERQAEPVLHVVVASPRGACRARCGCRSTGTWTRSTSAATRGWTPCTSGSTTGSGTCTTA